MKTSRSNVERVDLVGLSATRRQDDDRCQAAISNQTADFDSVDVRQTQVKNNHIRLETLDGFQTCRA